MTTAALVVAKRVLVRGAAPIQPTASAVVTIYMSLVPQNSGYVVLNGDFVEMAQTIAAAAAKAVPVKRARRRRRRYRHKLPGFLPARSAGTAHAASRDG
ncbi:hypothetical protein F5B21DRAFT_315797 [Xylaria acuta]|nr:hypothetical protein F5B21DRAFT_315797 [Xylaria acuta]